MSKLSPVRVVNLLSLILGEEDALLYARGVFNSVRDAFGSN